MLRCGHQPCVPVGRLWYIGVMSPVRLMTWSYSSATSQFSYYGFCTCALDWRLPPSLPLPLPPYLPPSYPSLSQPRTIPQLRQHPLGGHALSWLGGRSLESSRPHLHRVLLGPRRTSWRRGADERAAFPAETLPVRFASDALRSRPLQPPLRNTPVLLLPLSLFLPLLPMEGSSPTLLQQCLRLLQR